MHAVDTHTLIDTPVEIEALNSHNDLVQGYSEIQIAPQDILIT